MPHGNPNDNVYRVEIERLQQKIIGKQAIQVRYKKTEEILGTRQD